MSDGLSLAGIFTNVGAFICCRVNGLGSESSPCNILYVLAQDSIFIPSINIALPEISPSSNIALDISASILFAF